MYLSAIGLEPLSLLLEVRCLYPKNSPIPVGLQKRDNYQEHLPSRVSLQAMAIDYVVGHSHLEQALAPQEQLSTKNAHWGLAYLPARARSRDKAPGLSRYPA
jgi:hypothetical protein